MARLNIDTGIEGNTSTGDTIRTAMGKINIRNACYKNDTSPIDENNDYQISQQYSKAYLHHLFKTKEILGYRIATQHNLSFYNNLIKSARKAIQDGIFKDWTNSFLTTYNSK